MPETTLANFVRDLSRLPGRPPDGRPWQLIGQVEALVRAALGTLGDEFDLIGPEIAAHRTATVASSAELTGPVILGPGCRVGPGAVLRGGVWADQDVTIGPHSEIKASLVFAGSAAAHRNYVGNSIIGQDVNLEAGAVLANHFNERADKSVLVAIDGNMTATGLTKFGAILGDGCRIGANAVTSPGTLLPPGTIVARLALVDQLA